MEELWIEIETFSLPNYCESKDSISNANVKKQIEVETHFLSFTDFLIARLPLATNIYRPISPLFFQSTSSF
jgi:hypothetical protein